MKDVLLYGTGADAMLNQMVDQGMAQKTDNLYICPNGSVTECGEKPWLRQTPTTETPKSHVTTAAIAAEQPSSSTKIPWYIYAIGAGILLIGGILIFDNNKRK